jgi:hypothetical protein
VDGGAGIEASGKRKSNLLARRQVLKNISHGKARIARGSCSIRGPDQKPGLQEWNEAGTDASLPR